MQSFGRTLIILVCVVGIPVFAVFGDQLPKMVRQALGIQKAGDLGSGSLMAPPGVPSSASASPADLLLQVPQGPSPVLPSGATTPYGGSLVPTGASCSGTAPADMLGQVACVPSSLPAESEPGAVQPLAATIPETSMATLPAGYQAPPSTLGPAPQDGLPIPAALAATSGAIPSGAIPPSPGGQPPAMQPVAAPPPTSAGGRVADSPPLVASAGGQIDRFTAIQQRLQQLGATYYLLETWGTEQKLYRFYCTMSVGGSADYTRCFEETDADALQAMAKVLRDVEAWKTGQP